MLLGERLKQLRLNKKLTQEELGKRINVTKVSISGYENGNRTPDTDTLQKIADFFNVNTDYLLGRTDKPTYDDDDKEFNEFMNDPDLGLWFKELKESPEEQVDELRKIWEIIKSREHGRKPGDKQK